MSLRLGLVLLVGCTVLGGTPLAHADAPPSTDRTFSPQIFHPAVGPDELLTVESAQPLAHLNFSVGLWLNYARGLLNIDSYNAQTMTVGATRAELIKNALGGDLVAAIGLFDRAQVGLGVPVTLYQNGDDFAYSFNGTASTVSAPSGFALGDPWIDLKVRIWGQPEYGAQVAVGAVITLPGSLATANSFSGDSSVTVAGQALASWETQKWRAGLQLGYRWHANDSHFFADSIGNQLYYGAGVAFDVLPLRAVSLIGEIHGYSDVSGTSITNVDANPIELDVATKLRLQRSFYFNVGLGTGLHAGVGAPLIRVFAGITFAPDRRDRDHDGIPDVDDKCPDVPEDKDGFADEDGCPDPDNDGDGIPDKSDKCPNEAEDFDGFQDEDGCPEPDNDEDGVPDIKDACPNDREDGLPPKPNDGCPRDKTDEDGDGIPDYRDKCPSQPEDKDGWQDEDGCPDPDNDADGYPDKTDKCPNEAEDFDGFQDEDGCPELDNDGDGIPDDKDKCPNEPENINGFEDEDGCPDKGPVSKVKIVGDELIIMDKVFFDTNKATIQPRSFNLLDQVAATLKAHAELTRVSVEGHTDSKGPAAKNRKLSQARAESVVNYLVKHSVAATRLEAKGWGPDRPVEDNRTAKGREANRRVEFHITGRSR